MIEAILSEEDHDLFDALAVIAARPEGWALIGGMAVWCHLGSPHRPTLDIDAAARPAGRTTLLRLGAPETAPTRGRSKASSSR